MQAVVLAGGLATRMRPAHPHRPKSMLARGGPAVRGLAARAPRGGGMRDVVMCVAHLAEQIEAHVGDGARFGLRVALGPRGAKTPAERPGPSARRSSFSCSPPAFLVTYGDSYLPFDYAEPLRILEHHDDCDGVMAVLQERRPVGRLERRHRRARGCSRYEKGNATPRSTTSTTARPPSGARSSRRCRRGRGVRLRRDPARSRRAEALAGLHGP